MKIVFTNNEMSKAVEFVKAYIDPDVTDINKRNELYSWGSVTVDDVTGDFTVEYTEGYIGKVIDSFVPLVPVVKEALPAIKTLLGLAKPLVEKLREWRMAMQRITATPYTYHITWLDDKIALHRINMLSNGIEMIGFSRRADDTLTTKDAFATLIRMTGAHTIKLHGLDNDFDKMCAYEVFSELENLYTQRHYIMTEDDATVLIGNIVDRLVK